MIVADLADGRYLAGQLGVSEPGIHSVARNGAEVTVIVPGTG